jgi:hypothetical protein
MDLGIDDYLDYEIGDLSELANADSTVVCSEVNSRVCQLPANTLADKRRDGAKQYI